MANPYGRLDGKAPRLAFTGPDSFAIMPPIERSLPSSTRSKRDGLKELVEVSEEAGLYEQNAPVKPLTGRKPIR